MLTKPEYEILFADWLMQYGEEKTSRLGTVYWRVPKNSPARRDMLSILINTLIETHKYTKAELSATQTRDLIEEHCVWEDSKFKDSLKKQKKSVKEDLKIVIAQAMQTKFSDASEALEPRPNPPKLQKALDHTESLPDSYFGEEVELDPRAGSYDEEEVTITNPMDDSIFDSIPDIHYPMLTHEELHAKLEKEIADRKREENGDE